MKIKCNGCGKIVDVKDFDKTATCKDCGNTFSSLDSKIKEESINIPTGKIIGFIFLAIVIIILTISALSSFYTISAGYRGVILTWGKPQLSSISEGIHFKIPIAQEIVKMDIRTQRFDAPKASAASKDLQTVTTDVTLNYRIEPESVPKIYTEIGLDYKDKIIVPAVQEVVKASTAKFTAEELITKRPIAKDSIDLLLRERLLKSNIIVTEISITDFKFSSEFDNAIEAKVTAEQNALAAKNKLEQVKYEAEQRITQAKGEADAIAIQAQAINAQGGKDYVQLQAISKWNGQLPNVMLGQGSTPLVDISQFTK